MLHIFIRLFWSYTRWIIALNFVFNLIFTILVILKVFIPVKFLLKLLGSIFLWHQNTTIYIIQIFTPPPAKKRGRVKKRIFQKYIFQKYRFQRVIFYAGTRIYSIYNSQILYNPSFEEVPIGFTLAIIWEAMYITALICITFSSLPLVRKWEAMCIYCHV